MRLLFTLETGDPTHCTRQFIRHSARCITQRNGRVAMVHSRKFDYYKFPGGGIEEQESPREAMIRETIEEAGLEVIPASVREYGYVHREQNSSYDPQERFIQDNFYFLCQVEEDILGQHLDGYEAEEGFALRWVTPEEAIRVNRFHHHGTADQTMLEREARVLELLMEEKLI